VVRVARISLVRVAAELMHWPGVPKKQPTKQDYGLWVKYLFLQAG
jgi:hypothetical protein